MTRVFFYVALAATSYTVMVALNAENYMAALGFSLASFLLVVLDRQSFLLAGCLAVLVEARETLQQVKEDSETITGE
jgi:hypothetical protein